MLNIGKWLVFMGLGIVVVGLLFWIGGRLGLGRLPGDLHVEGAKFKIYFPIATSIIISILLTVVVNLIFWLLRK